MCFTKRFSSSKTPSGTGIVTSTSLYTSSFLPLLIVASFPSDDFATSLYIGVMSTVNTFSVSVFTNSSTLISIYVTIFISTSASSAAPASSRASLAVSTSLLLTSPFIFSSKPSTAIFSLIVLPVKLSGNVTFPVFTVASPLSVVTTTSPTSSATTLTFE